MCLSKTHNLRKKFFFYLLLLSKYSRKHVAIPDFGVVYIFIPPTRTIADKKKYVSNIFDYSRILQTFIKIGVYGFHMFPCKSKTNFVQQFQKNVFCNKLQNCCTITDLVFDHLRIVRSIFLSLQFC